MTTQYPCPFCPSTEPSFEKIEQHITNRHEGRIQDALAMFYRKLQEETSIMIPMSRITKDELGLIKGDIEYDHTEGCIIIKNKGNEWIKDIGLSSAYTACEESLLTLLY